MSVTILMQVAVIQIESYSLKIYKEASNILLLKLISFYPLTLIVKKYGK